MKNMMHSQNDTEILSYPANRTSCFFDSLQQVHQCLECLLKNGFDESDVNLIGGHEAAESLDMDGDHHGIYGRLAKTSEKFFDNEDPELVQRAHEEAHLGHYLFTVLTMNDEEKNVALRFMRQFGGHELRHNDEVLSDDSPRLRVN